MRAHAVKMTPPATPTYRQPRIQSFFPYDFTSLTRPKFHGASNLPHSGGVGGGGDLG